MGDNIKKMCIFDTQKICDNCRECDICDIDRTKKCNNCGKCLELDEAEIRAIKIDEIIDNADETMEYETALNDRTDDKDEQLCECCDDYDSDKYSQEDKYSENKDTWEYIDDIEGLSDVLEDEKKFDKLLEEKFPGFIRFRKEK